MTSEEYWSTIWEVASDRFIVVQEDLKTRDGILLKPGSLFDDWKRGVYMVFPISVRPSEFQVVLRAHAKFGGIVLWAPTTLEDALVAGGIGIKNHWYEGEICYERKQSLKDYELFHRPLNRQLVARTEMIRDSDGEKLPHKGSKCSKGAIEWVENKGILKELAKGLSHSVVL